MKNAVLNMLVYGGLSSEQWKKVYPDIQRSNRKSLRLYSVLAVIGFGAALVLSFFTASMADKRPIYIACVAGSVVVLLVERPMKDSDTGLRTVLMMLFELLFLGMGAAMSLVTCRDETAVLLPVLFPLVPLLFTERPIHIICVQEFVNIVYIVGSVLLRPREILPLEIVNSVVFSSVGLIIGSYMINVKLERFLYEKETAELMELRSRDALTDHLTGLANRRAWQEALDGLSNADNLIIASADINGLKAANDTYGHSAGDSLIRAAADALTRVFGREGRVYRVGGDEFEVLLCGTREEMEQKIAALAEEEKKWQSDYGGTLHVAVGFACRAEHPDISLEKLGNLADRAMYEQKSAWYCTNGIDRRKI